MAAPIYATDPEESVSMVPLDGLTALFHAPSGITHILASPAPEILAALRQGPTEISGLVARLRAAFELEGEEAIATRLDELEDAGLVRRA